MNGYEYTRQLKAKIARSPTHTLDLGDAIDFIKFYGLRNLFNAQGDIRFVGQVAIDVLDRAISKPDSASVFISDVLDAKERYSDE